MAEHNERTDPGATADAAEAAVGRLGAASAFRRREGASATPGALDLAGALASDIDFLGAVPSYARIHGQRSEALSAALDGIWPRSSPLRPSDPAASEERCLAIVGTMDAEEAPVARRIGELPPGEQTDRLLADARQALLLDARLAAAGLHPRRLDETEQGRAAAALDALFRDRRILSRPALREALSASSTLCDRLLPILPDMRRLVGLAGLPEATPSQVALLAKWLSSAPDPWPATAAPDDAVATLAAEVESSRSVADAAASLDAAHGVSWRGEEPGKLEAAARILGEPSDPRGVKAEAYASGIGVPADGAAKALSTMARTKLGLRKPWPPACMAALAGAIPHGMSEDPAGALAYLRSCAEWRDAAARTETLRRLRASMDALPDTERGALAAGAPGMLSALQSIPPGRRTGSAVALVEAMSLERDGLTASAAALEGFTAEACEAARRPAGHLRERRACLDRIRADAAFPSLGVDEPEEIVAALAWADAAAATLPEGVDPGSRHAGLVHERSREVVAAAGEILRMEAESRERIGASDPDALVRAGRIALADIKLAEARAEVEATGGWAIVAWLEAEGIEPELWVDALASRAIERAAEPKDDPAPPAPERGPGADPADARQRPERRPAPTGGLAWRRVGVVAPQAALARMRA